jgi:hypothetical protein
MSAAFRLMTNIRHIKLVIETSDDIHVTERALSTKVHSVTGKSWYQMNLFCTLTPLARQQFVNSDGLFPRKRRLRLLNAGWRLE